MLPDMPSAGKGIADQRAHAESRTDRRTGYKTWIVFALNGENR